MELPRAGLMPPPRRSATLPWCRAAVSPAQIAAGPGRASGSDRAEASLITLLASPPGRPHRPVGYECRNRPILLSEVSSRDALYIFRRHGLYLLIYGK